VELNHHRTGSGEPLVVIHGCVELARETVAAARWPLPV
jgi:hypothetical protein